MNKLKTLLGSVGAAAMVMGLAVPVSAADETVVVTPANTNGWYEADVRPGGDINFVTDATSPYPDGALQLTTDGTTAAKAQYMHEADVALSEVEELSYYTKQNSGPATAAPSYQIEVDLNGEAAGGFTTLVYEPYWNGTVVPGTWQEWDVDAGQFWSSRTFTEGTCAVVNGAGGPPLYSLTSLQTLCPDAEVLAFGVNVGTFNPNYDVETDGVNFNGTVYDFELVNEPASKDECKKDGYKTLTDAEGNAFRNQGQCVSYYNHL
jgi:hypothetical protein